MRTRMQLQMRHFPMEGQTTAPPQGLFIRKHDDHDDNEVESFLISIYIGKFSGDLVRYTANQ